MYNAFLIGCTILSAAIVARLILKRCNAIFVFFTAGAVLLMAAGWITGAPILGKVTLGNVFLDTFGFIGNTFKKNVSGVGAIIMVVTGYAAYMKHIQASTKLAYLAGRPLGRIKNRYLVLSGMFLVGIALKLVITSQAGLAVLLLATAFPVLMAIGISPLTAASVLCLVCLDYGPNDGSTVFMAGVLKLDVVALFLQHQVYVAASIIAVLTLLIPSYYRYMDNRDRARGLCAPAQAKLLEDPDCPAFYALLPIMPLGIVFAAYFMPAVKVDVITANVLGIAVTFAIEFIRRKDRGEIPKDIVVILRAMGDIFVSVVSIIIAASVFAEGIKLLGGISILANAIAEMDGAVLLTIALLAGITFAFAVIMGSGAAPFFAFGPLTPEIAGKLGVPAVALILPMELSAAIGRALSPVAGAVIAIAGCAGVDTVAVVKRTAFPLLVALAVNILASYVFLAL